jgi:hypothetical protein
VNIERLGDSEAPGQGQPDPGALDLGLFGAEALERDEYALEVVWPRPGPVSETTMCTWPAPSSVQEIVMLPSWWLYFTALEIGLTGTWASRCRSAWTARAGRALCWMIRIERPAAIGAISTQGEQLVPGTDDPVDAVTVFVAEVGHLQELREAEDGVKRGPRLVARARQERVLHLAGFQGRIPGRRQLRSPSGQQRLGREVQLGQRPGVPVLSGYCDVCAPLGPGPAGHLVGAPGIDHPLR